MLRDDYVLGTAQLTRPYGALGARAGEREDPHALLSLAEGRGFRAVDTAPTYGDAEEVIGRSGTGLEVHTKLAPGIDPGHSVLRSLHRLDRAHVDLLYVHDASLLHRDPDDVIGAAHTLVGESVRRLGVSVYDPAELEAATEDGRFTVVQVPYNLVDRRFDPRMLARATARGIRVLARSLLIQGVLVADPDDLPGDVAHLAQVPRQLAQIGARAGRSTLELALGWVRAHEQLSGLVIGAESATQLAQIADALEAAPLSPSELALLEAMDVPDPAVADPRIWAPDISRAVSDAYPPPVTGQGDEGSAGELR